MRPAPTASPTAGAAAAAARSASPRSTAGRTTRTSTRRAGCSGRSSRSTAGRSPGPTCWSSPATLPWSRWGSRRSASASGERTSGSPRRSSGAPRTPGSEMSATPATGNSRGLSAPITSGLEGAWTNNPTKWDNGFLENLFKYDWELTTSPGGAKQWAPKNPEAQGTVPDPHDPSKKHAPMMLTTDLALKVDPIYGPIAKRFHEHPDQLADAFAKAWYKLLHRDMGPLSRYLGPWVPEPQLWQDPVPEVDHELIDEADIATLKDAILASGVSTSRLVST